MVACPSARSPTPRRDGTDPLVNMSRARTGAREYMIRLDRDDSRIRTSSARSQRPPAHARGLPRPVRLSRAGLSWTAADLAQTSPPLALPGRLLPPYDVVTFEVTTASRRMALPPRRHRHVVVTDVPASTPTCLASSRSSAPVTAHSRCSSVLSWRTGAARGEALAMWRAGRSGCRMMTIPSPMVVAASPGGARRWEQFHAATYSAYSSSSGSSPS